MKLDGQQPRKMDEVGVRGEDSELSSVGRRADQKVRVRTLNALGATTVEEGRRFLEVIGV
jgi:hypothetical protein